MTMIDRSGPHGRGSGIDRYMPATGDAPAEASPMQMIDLAFLRAIAWRQRYILLGVTALGLLLGLVFTLLATPMYKATATARVSESAFIVEGQDIADPYLRPNQIYDYLITMREVLTSRAMAQRVAQSMDLSNNSSQVPGLAEWQASGDPSRDPTEFLIATLMSGISATIPNDAQIMEIEFSSTSSGFAAKAANAYVEALVTENITQGAEANSFAREYLEKEIAGVRAQLSEAERSAIDYARANRIVGEPLGEAATDAAGAGTAPTLTASALYDITTAYNAARARRIEAEQRWRTVAGLPASQLPEVQQSVTVQNLQGSLAEKQSELADLQERYRADYPAVREATAEIANLRSQIGATGSEIKNGIRSQFLVAQRQEAGLKRELDQVSNDTLDEQDRRVQYNFINREVGGLREQLAALIQRYNQISAASNLQTSRITPLDMASVPKAPYSPNLVKNLFVALILGMGCAFMLAVTIEIFDSRLRSIEDVEQKVNLVGLGQTPWVPDGIEHEIDDNFTPISEAYSSIRASLDFSMLSSGPKAIQFTSCEPGEGKSTSCAAIARKYALVGKKTLLVDMDLRRPSLQKAFKTIRPKAGIVDVLFGRTPLSHAVVDVGIPNLDLLPVAEIPANPVEIMSSGLVAEFIERSKQAYDVILIDSSPVLGIADAPLLARFVDAVVFVIEANNVSARQARSSVRRLIDMDANIVGAIMTKFRALEAGQSYDYQYRYYSYSKDDA